MSAEDPQSPQPLDAMAEALRNHTRDYPLHRSSENALEEVMRLRSEVENMQVQGGKVAWPTVTTPDTGSGRRDTGGATVVFTRLVNGVLMGYNVKVDGDGSSFGPFA